MTREVSTGTGVGSNNRRVACRSPYGELRPKNIVRVRPPRSCCVPGHHVRQAHQIDRRVCLPVANHPTILHRPNEPGPGVTLRKTVRAEEGNRPGSLQPC